MGRMSEIAGQIDELKNCSKVLTEIADVLSELLEVKESEETVVEEKKVLSFEEVRAVLAKKSREGHTAEVKAILSGFNVDKFSDIDCSQYEDLLEKVEAI